MELSIFIKKIFIPTKLKPIRKAFGAQKLAILDVGCGNESFAIANKWLKIQLYHGIDKEYWHNKKEDYEKMEHVFFVDLDQPQSLSIIPENTYNVVILNHVIEHLLNGYQVVIDLYGKLLPGGLIYIETPSVKTVNYPSGIGFLNFYDDPTHKKIYPVVRLVETTMVAGFRVLKFGTRRDWKRIILFSPLSILWNVFYSLPFRRKIDARGLWDILGVASYVIARKPTNQQSEVE